MRNTFIKTLTELAAQDERIILLTADLGFSVVEEFATRYPKRFFNVGIAEQNAVGIAAGLALSGKKPYVYSIIPFVTMRCFEQVRVDVAYQNTNVKLVGVGAGLGYGPAGATHHAIEDISLMRSLPNMAVVAPGDPYEVKQLAHELVRFPGPAYIRLGKGGEPRVHTAEIPITLGKAAELASGGDLAILTTSNQLETGAQLVERLKAHGLAATLLSFHTVKPLDSERVKELVARGMPIFTLEEHSLIGGLGSAVAEIIAESGKGIPFERLAFPDLYAHQVGSQNYLRKHYGLDADSLLQRILKRLGRAA
jgi:transketolase